MIHPSVKKQSKNPECCVLRTHDSLRIKRDGVEIENIHRRATKLIPEVKHLPYDKGLRALRLPTPMRRGDMKQTYKIINGIDRVDRKTFFELSSGSATRGHIQKLVKKHARFGNRQSVFSQRVING